ncbi:13222_t:CDS:1 [Ambispora gerdemannii]|uniref:13222_t:CDS:1 n=1 Tax=Ambispora gerdemannii TaxID=144530 RepID=A0A9N9EWR5_9GLOM|nr:13222_t:CDS:1 [Ambispora gerdemannii]
MRSSIIFVFSLFFALVFSTASAADGNSSSSADPKGCSQCWVSARGKIQECTSISQTELSSFSDASDTTLAQNSANYPTLIPCLCTLVKKIDSILSGCSACSGDLGTGLKTEALIVGQQVCGIKKDSTTNDSTDVSSSSSSSDSSASSENSNGDVKTASYSTASSLSSPSSLVSLTLALVAALIFTL